MLVAVVMVDDLFVCSVRWLRMCVVLCAWHLFAVLNCFSSWNKRTDEPDVHSFIGFGRSMCAAIEQCSPSNSQCAKTLPSGTVLYVYILVHLEP